MEVMARMRKLTTVRSLSMAVAALVLITGCAGTGKAPAQPGATIFSPTGAPSGLTQIEGAKGEQVPLGDAPGAVVPAGSTSDPVESDEQGKSVLYQMPDANADRYPSFRVSWGSCTVGRETLDQGGGVVRDIDRALGRGDPRAEASHVRHHCLATVLHQLVKAALVETIAGTGDGYRSGHGVTLFRWSERGERVPPGNTGW